MRLGAHLALARGYSRALERAGAMGCTAAQIFTHSPRSFAFKPLEPARQKILRDGWKRLGIDPVVSHASYLINIASPDHRTFHGALHTLAKEVEYAKAFGCRYLVLHPGRHKGTSPEEGIRRIAEAIGTLPLGDVMLLLEVAAGQGSEIGRTFTELQHIIERIPSNERVGVCLDTCHLFAAGYDLRSPGTIIEEIERTIGFGRVRLVHVNDSKFERGSRKDRHEHLGLGKIGTSALSAFLTHPKIKKLPMIIETPEDTVRDHAGNLATLRELL